MPLILRRHTITNQPRRRNHHRRQQDDKSHFGLSNTVVATREIRRHAIGDKSEGKGKEEACCAGTGDEPGGDLGPVVGWGGDY